MQTKRKKTANQFPHIETSRSANEKKELDKIGAEAAIFLQGLNKRGYVLLPAGSFLGSNLNVGYQVVKVKKTRVGNNHLKK